MIGRMSGFRNIPFNIQVPRMTAGTSVSWVGQAAPTPVSTPIFDVISFPTSKIAGLTIISRDLARLSDPSAEVVIEQDMLSSIAAFSDLQFLDPTLAAVSDVSPSSISFGSPAIASTSASAAQIEADFLNLFDAVETNLTSPYLIMRPTTARISCGAAHRVGGFCVSRRWRSRRQHLGCAGTGFGNVPLFENSPQSSYIFLIDAAEILLADAGISFRPPRRRSWRSYQTRLIRRPQPALWFLCSRQICWA